MIIVAWNGLADPSSTPSVALHGNALEKASCIYHYYLPNRRNLGVMSVWKCRRSEKSVFYFFVCLFHPLFAPSPTFLLTWKILRLLSLPHHPLENGRIHSTNTSIVSLRIYTYQGKAGNKSDCVNMYKKEKLQGLQTITLVKVWIFANVKRFGF